MGRTITLHVEASDAIDNGTPRTNSEGLALVPT